MKRSPARVYICDCCGTRMVERSCKVSCPNCGYRFDCSDLTLNFDPPDIPSAPSNGKQPNGQQHPTALR